MTHGKNRRILLLRLDAIGDFVLFTSVLPHFRSIFRGDHITLIVNANTQPLAEGCPYVDKILGVDPARYVSDPRYVQEIAVQVRGLFDVAINTMYTRTIASDNIIARTHAPVKIGYECIDKDGQESRRLQEQTLYTCLVRTDRNWVFEIERHSLLLRELGLNIESQKLKPEYWIRAEDEIAVAKLIRKNLSYSRGYAVICPGAGFDIKLWSTDAMAEVADYLISAYELEIIIAGSEKERPLAAAIRAAMKFDSHDLTGQLTLPQFASLMQNAAIYVGIDTAGFHMSWTQGVPTVGIFGGGHYGRFTPTSPHVRVVHLPMDCYYCYWNCIYDSARCIMEITPKMVIDAIAEVYNPATRTDSLT